MRFEALLAGLFLVLIFCVYSILKYTRMISNIFLSLVYNPDLSFSASRGEKLTILDSADQEIEALFVEKKNSKKAVIFCHESGTGKESWEKYAAFFPEMGFHVLSLDFHGSGEADGNALRQWPAAGDVEKLTTVIRWAKKALEPDRIVLFGISNGADIAFAASFRDSAVAAVIADGLFSMKEIFRDYIRKWGPILVKPNLLGDHYPSWVVNLFAGLGLWYCQKKSGKSFIDIERLLRKAHVPLLMIHGERDDYVPEGHQRFLEKINHKRCVVRRLAVPRAGHNEAVVLAKDAYEQHIKNFLGQFL